MFHRPYLRGRQQDGPRAGEWVEDEVAVPDGGEVRHEEAERGVHGRVPDELARLDRHPRQQVAPALAHTAAEEKSEKKKPILAALKLT